MGWAAGVFSRVISGGWTTDKLTTPAITAARHDTNDDDLATGINACVAKDGSNAFTGDANLGNKKITNLGAATLDADAVRKDQVATLAAVLVPSGVILPYGGATAPTGFLLCNGAAVSRTTYAALFTAIGVAYGVGDNSTTFNLPDYRERSPIGKGTTLSTLGATGGSINHTHTGPSHTHTAPAHYHGLGTVTVASAAAHNHAIRCATGLGGSTTQFTNHADSYTTQGNNLGSAGTTETGGGHSHSIAGVVGVAGTDGDAAMTTGADGTGATGVANAPYQVCNFIIKT